MPTRPIPMSPVSAEGSPGSPLAPHRAAGGWEGRLPRLCPSFAISFITVVGTGRRARVGNVWGRAPCPCRAVPSSHVCPADHGGTAMDPAAWGRGRFRLLPLASTPVAPAIPARARGAQAVMAPGKGAALIDCTLINRSKSRSCVLTKAAGSHRPAGESAQRAVLGGLGVSGSWVRLGRALVPSRCHHPGLLPRTPTAPRALGSPTSFLPPDSPCVQIFHDPSGSSLGAVGGGRRMPGGDWGQMLGDAGPDASAGGDHILLAPAWSLRLLAASTSPRPS